MLYHVCGESESQLSNTYLKKEVVYIDLKKTKEIKQILPQSLSVPDYEEAFEIEVDSSILGHGACLFQAPEGKGRKREIQGMGFGGRRSMAPAFTGNYNPQSMSHPMGALSQHTVGR